jgi:hypothetical protein
MSSKYILLDIHKHLSGIRKYFSIEGEYKSPSNFFRSFLNILFPYMHSLDMYEYHILFYLQNVFMVSFYFFILID